MPKNLHKILELLMTVMILLLSYFLPGKCVQWLEEEPQAVESSTDGGETGGQKTQQTAKSLMNGSKMSEQEPDQISDQKTDDRNKSNSMDEQGENGQKEKVQTDDHNTDHQPGSSTNIIMLDPGHGGDDPGMVGIGGIKEKELNLQIAKRLATLLEQQGYQVVLTRNSDAGLYDADTNNKKAQDMQRRCALIEEKKPCLTVSIHQNSYTDPDVYGPQVFYFEHSAEGKKLAAEIQEKLNTLLEIARPRVIKGNTNYYILKRSASLTVLVECSFLSNPEEAAKIQTEDYQEKVVRAICAGILEYRKSVETEPVTMFLKRNNKIS